MSEKVVISGGSGLIGSHLTGLLLKQGYQVVHLSRSIRKDKGAKHYLWDVGEGKIEEGALQDAAYIINLAGAPLADLRWTAANKQKMMRSRTASTSLLVRELARLGVKPKAFISASGINYYGGDSGEELLREQSEAGEDFLGSVCRAWEQEALRAEEQGIRVVLLRIGIVLSTDGGALTQLMLPFRFGLGAALGSGRQYMSWIHIDDLCQLFLKAMTDPHMQGPYNAVAPEPVTNAHFSEVLAAALHKPYFLPALPGVFMKLALGEKAVMVLGSTRASADKLQKAGFAFRYPALEAALHQLLE
ncbi:TIGR01777 family oxidoreductase [Cesiribacter andamanensis]|uniref:Epimerase family protein n=1 Tax=Cesiribacter andamanensis AMV16 TaxID=1279009 RepID=M7NPI5_9BACT|nr:TIGR01777 family oxidoreductase [Cesiribacter andamanensis]EMR03630.1 Epimerase family protein [Cesiribacter andamanensis AMV16]